jgi:hypothetical protein
MIISLNLPADQVEAIDHAAEQFLQTRSGLARLVFKSWLENPNVPAAMKELLAAQSPAQPRGA